MFTDAPDRAERELGAPRQLSYVEADAIVDSLAREFRDAGLSAGDVIAIQAPNTIETPLLLLAAWRASLVPCLLPLLWRLDEIHHAFSLVNPRAAVACTRYGDDEPAQTLGEAAAKHMSMRFVFAFGEHVPDGITPLDDAFATPDVAERPGDPDTGSSPDQADQAALITWAVSGRGPYPVVRTHSEILALSRLFGAHLKFRRSDIVLNTYPYTSVSALAGQLVAPLLAGCQVALHLPFDFDVFVHQLEEQSITCAAVPAPVIAALEERHNLRTGKLSLTRIGCVWPSPHAVKPGAGLFETPLPVFDIYNFGELAVILRERASGSDPSLLPLGKLFIPGDEESDTPVVETRVRGSVKSEDEQQVLKGTLTVRGSSVPSSTAIDVDAPDNHVLRPDAHGFLDTGIGCYVDETLSNQFRCKKSEDVIYHGGTVIAASELDRLYGEFSEFLDAAAFVIDDAVMGERIFAAVLPRPDQAPSLERLKAFLAERRVAPHKTPDQLVIVKTIPRSNDGTVLRDQILAQL